MKTVEAVLITHGNSVVFNDYVSNVVDRYASDKYDIEFQFSDRHEWSVFITVREIGDTWQDIYLNGDAPVDPFSASIPIDYDVTHDR